MIVIDGSRRGKMTEGGRRRDVTTISSSPTNVDGQEKESVDAANLKSHLPFKTGVGDEESSVFFYYLHFLLLIINCILLKRTKQVFHFFFVPRGQRLKFLF